MAIGNALYKEADFTFSGDASAAQTDAGTATMGLAAEQFANTNPNFATVTFTVTDGYVTVNPIDVAVTITGHTDTADYDGKAHTVEGYDVAIGNALYKEADFTFSGDASAAQTDAGTATMGLAAEQFANTNPNFATVTFTVTDGYVTVNPIDVAVTITGHTDTADYDGEAHTVTGYDVAIGNALYKEADFTFSGDASAKQTDAGTAAMGLAAEQFINTNPNFATVTFNVTDGYLKVERVDAVITTAPISAEPIYDGSNKELVIPGETDGGTVYYAVSQDPQNAPSDDSFTDAIPTAAEPGSYYVWYKVKADANHNDLATADAVRVILAREDWVELSGSLYQNDGVTAVGNAVVTLMNGNRTVDYVITDEDGSYRFIVPADVYSIVVEYGQTTQTEIVTLFSDKTQDTTISGGKTQSQLLVDSGDGAFNAAVGGLNEEAQYIRRAGNIPEDQSVSVLMTLESKTKATAQNAEAIRTLADDKSLIFFDARVEQTVDSTTTVLNETATVLEIAVPYENVGKRDLAVYYSDGFGVRALTESTSREEGTFFVDKENGLIYIYSNRFSTFAIGYTPYYKVESSASLGSFAGTVTVTVTNKDGVEVYKLENVAMNAIGFDDIPKGQYTVTVTWVDGVENTLTFPLAVGDDAFEQAQLKAARRDGVAVMSAFGGFSEIAASPFTTTIRQDGESADAFSDALGAYSLSEPYKMQLDMSRFDPDRLLRAAGRAGQGYLRI